MSEIETLEGQLAKGEKLNPTELQALAKNWAKAIAAKEGKDDGKKELTKALEPYVKKLNKEVSANVASVALNALSEAVESQLTLARYLDKAAVAIRLLQPVFILWHFSLSNSKNTPRQQRGSGRISPYY